MFNSLNEIENIRFFIENNGGKKDFFLKKEIELHTNSSYETIRKKFRNYYGISLKEYHNKVLEREALKLLAEGQKVYVISILLGFCDDSHFIIWFKKRKGHTPERYRTLWLCNHMSKPIYV